MRLSGAGGPTKVYCYPVTSDSAYVPLLFRGTDERYVPVYRDDATVADAVDDLQRGLPVILHVHWEEFVFRGCRSNASADDALCSLEQLLRLFRAGGGRIVWTVHNEMPHVVRWERQFLRARGLLAELSDAVLVHDIPSIERLAAQIDLARERVWVLPHPSYLDEYEGGAALRAGLGHRPTGVVQCFGWIRRQKGFGDLIAMLGRDYLAARRLRIRVSGAGVELGAVKAQNPDRDDVIWDVRHVPDAEVPALLRAATCVVLPYRRVLTSGAALVAMSVGAPLVAVDDPAFRDLLPASSQELLYPSGNGLALKAIIDRLHAMKPPERASLIDANLAIARGRHPRRVSKALADIYDALLTPSGSEGRRAMST